MNKPGYVYMLADDRYGTLYIGVTSNLPQRVAQHRLERTEGFTKKYNVKRLVWYECHDEIGAAILREKQLKKWRREWKIRLIHSMNPMWNDLYPSIL